MAELSDSGGGGHKKGGKKRMKKSSTRIDFTPMVDLGFLLITFFMLTTTLSKPVTMEINMPAKPEPGDPPPPEVKASKVLTLMLSHDDRIVYYKGVETESPTVESTEFGKDGVRKLLLEHKADVQQRFADEDNPAIVIIKPDEDSVYKNVVDILDEINITDIQRYALVDITPQEKDFVKKAWEGGNTGEVPAGGS
ncbi:MAG: biopolymer transporter ExbD [Chitinophagales bacterium]|jgi:biopolymer transport protein ExbD|nr:biopolymer transporter ExbD [Chitinophagales bacterium]